MEHLTQTMTYVLTLGLAAILPGPGMTGLMFKTLVQGYKNGLMMLCGLITGDITFLLISIFLFSSLHHFSPHLVFYLILLSSSYLLYLAYKFWFLTVIFWKMKHLRISKTLFFPIKMGC